MSEENFSEIETEVPAEWIYLAVLEADSFVEIIQAIESGLAEFYLKEPNITEAEIDESIEIDLSMLKEDYEQGDITKEEYDRECIEAINRETVRRELIEADSGGNLRNSHAAIELLVALLGTPNVAFQHALEVADQDVSGREFKNKIDKFTKRTNEEQLKSLLPEALKIVSGLKENKSVNLLGFYGKKDKKSWLDYLDGLEDKLSSHRK